MIDQVEKIKKEIEAFAVSSQEELEQFRLKFIGRKNIITDLFTVMKDVPAQERKSFGIALNELKQLAQQKFKDVVQTLEQNSEENIGDAPIDLTLPPSPDAVEGSLHPLTIIKARISEIFEHIGFNQSYGPEIEDDWHNFSALNFPEDHPAREMQDTFFIDKNSNMTLRTHTSSVQVRVMETEKPPIRTLSIGRVYRNEAISARAHCIFHQVEGLYINEGVSFVDLKQTLFYFAKEMFTKDTKIRFRPSYFPFTEPSAEMDISCQLCHGEGCNICKYSGWVEIGGAGMVDPQVLQNCKIDPKKFSGFAFGMGLERIAMLKYQINDLRLFTENDIRFLKQFSKILV